MIPEIGFMLGAYIVTRMLALFLKPGTKEIVRFMAIGTIIAAIVVMADLALRGSTGAGLPFQ